MPTTITGTDGVSQVQAGSIQSDDLAAGVGGKVLQAVQKTSTSIALTTSSTYANLSNLNVSITPNSATSSILVLLSVPVTADADQDGQECDGQLKVVRSSGVDTDIFESASETISKGGYGRFWSWAPLIKDSPNTTSQITYQFFYRRTAGNSALFVNASETASIILMEIAG